jgi:DNA repair photolyase
MLKESANRVFVKKLLKKEKQPALFGGKYRFSPYMACGHRCTYCDGRYEKYHVEGDFDRDVVARENTPELLEQEIQKLREPGPICISSGISDPYQPLEEQLQLTGKCAEILSRYEHPVIIHTKSALVLRDIDHWEKVHRKSSFTLMVSLTMTDDAIRSRLEPGASSVKDRLEALCEFSRRGMHTGILAMPFIPFLTDSVEQISELLNAVKLSGVQFAIPGILTLKTGRQKDFFLTFLNRQYPLLYEEIANLYSGEDLYGNPSPKYLESFFESSAAVWAGHGMDDLVPHRVFQGQFSLYDEFTVLLRDMITLYRRKGIDVARLKAGARKYSEWLLPRLTYYARKRSLNYRAINDELTAMAGSGALVQVIGNEKLAAFLADVASGAVLNYQTLELMGKQPEKAPEFSL